MKNLSEDEDYSLWVLLTQTRETIFKARRKAFAQYNISPKHVAVLILVEAIAEKATPAELARCLSREPQSVSELLSRMEKEGLVRKVKDLERKNQVRVELTDKGREVYYRGTREEPIHSIMSSLSEEERQQLKSCLHKLRNKALNGLGKEYPFPFPPSK